MQQTEIHHQRVARASRDGEDLGIAAGVRDRRVPGASQTHHLDREIHPERAGSRGSQRLGHVAGPAGDIESAPPGRGSMASSRARMNSRVRPLQVKSYLPAALCHPAYSSGKRHRVGWPSKEFPQLLSDYRVRIRSRSTIGPAWWMPTRSSR